MIRIGNALPSDYGASHQYLDKEDPNNDEEGKGEDNVNTQDLGDFQGSMFLQLYDSDLEIEDNLEGDIDESTIFIDVHAR